MKPTILKPDSLTPDAMCEAIKTLRPDPVKFVPYLSKNFEKIRVLLSSVEEQK